METDWLFLIAYCIDAAEYKLSKLTPLLIE